METKAIYTELELLRRTSKITIKELCKGIMSDRSYRRYIYLEKDMPFHKLSKILEKLYTDVFTFLYYVEMKVSRKYYKEYNLLEYIVQEMFEEANELYDKIKKPFRSVYAKLGLPAFLKVLDLYNRKTTKVQVYNHMIELLEPKKLINHNIISTDHIKMIEYIVDNYNYVDKTIISILERIVSNEMYIVPLSNYSQNRCHFILLKCKVYSNDTIDLNKKYEETLPVIKNCIDQGGEAVLDEILNEIATSEYYKENDQFHDLMLKYGIASAYVHPMGDIEEEDLIFIKNNDIEQIMGIHSLVDEVNQHEK